MRISDFMSTDVETAHVGETAAEALERMRTLRIRHLVVTRGREVLGIVSDRDLAGFGGDYPGTPYTVGDLMTDRVVTARPDATVREAANLLRGRAIGCLPVVDRRGAVIGIVTTSDLLDLVGRGWDAPAPRRERRTLSRRGPRVKPLARAGRGAGR